MIQYKAYYDHAIVKNLSGNYIGKVINIKNNYMGLPVTRIGKDAFSSAAVESVILPKTITRISNRAFVSSDLIYITIPETTKTICAKAFRWCYYLKNVSMPKRMNTIEEYSFSKCQSLESIKLPSSVTIGDNAFSECSSLSAIDIPDTFISIGAYCFFSDDRLQNITVRFNASDDWLGVAVRIFGTYED